MTRRKPDPIRGALAGLAAGLVASFVMSQAQKAFAAFGAKSGSGDPATVKAANKAGRATTGRSIEPEQKDGAGEAVHCATGAALGLAYGLAAVAGAAREPGIRAGVAFGVRAGRRGYAPRASASAIWCSGRRCDRLSR